MEFAHFVGRARQNIIHGFAGEIVRGRRSGRGSPSRNLAAWGWDLAGSGAGSENRGGRFPEIGEVLEQGVRVAVPLDDQGFRMVGIEIALILQGPGVLGAD